MANEVDLLSAYWIGSGPVELGGREWSLVDWRDRCNYCVRAGFTGIGLWHEDLRHQLQARPLSEIKQIFDGCGLTHLELSYLSLADAAAEPTDPLRRKADARRALLLDAAEALGARHIKVVSGGAHREPERLVEEFARLCEEAGNRTDALMVYEFMATGLDVNVRTLADAVAVVDGAGQVNARLLVDTWHLAKSGIGPADLGVIRHGSIGWAELADGTVDSALSIREETMTDRRLPGDGEFDITGFIDAWRVLGYDGPWGIEVMSDSLRSLSPELQYERAYTAGAAQFERGGQFR